MHRSVCMSVVGECGYAVRPCVTNCLSQAAVCVSYAGVLGAISSNPTVRWDKTWTCVAVGVQEFMRACVRACVCVGTHTRICTYTSYTFAYNCIGVHISNQAFMYRHRCPYLSLDMQIHPYTRACTHTQTRTQTHIYIHPCIHARVVHT